MSTLILSYPGPGRGPGDAPADPAQHPAADVRAHAAMGQWLTLADHITRAGGHILILDAHSPATLYAGRLGAMFLNGGAGNRPLFLRSRGPTPPTPDEPDPVGRDLAQAGLELRTCRHRFQGQADVIALDRNRFILTYTDDPAGTSRDSLDEIKALLPMGAQTLEVALQTPYTAGSQGIAYLVAPGGAKVLLQNRGALGSHTPEDVARFAGNRVENFVLLAEDVAAYATECLVVRGTVILGQGSSTILRGLLARRGFPLVETDVSALFAGGRGGPRLLANDLPGLVLSDDAPSYALRREELLELRATYLPPPKAGSRLGEA